MNGMKKPGGERPRLPRWREDFPIRWEWDGYVTRRELAKFLTLGSALLVLANGMIAVFGKLRRARPAGRISLGRASALASGESRLFRFPTDADPCILLRTRDGRLAAYSQVCTHLSCAVVYRPEGVERRGGEALFCPCHLGSFSCGEGRPTAGPPTRPLPRIRLEQQGDDLFAVGVEA
jgi:nitrite reductase/ring-hydroxylating ferredoxin subunit